MNGAAGFSPYLEVKSGELAGMSFPLTKQEILLGRGEDCDITLPDEMVSKTHARITIRPDAIIIDDLDSTNGTIVNGISIQSHILQEGDLVYLGSTEMVFHSGAAGPAGIAAPVEKTRRKVFTLPVLIGVIVAVTIIVVGLVITLFVLKGREEAKDTTPPEVEVVKPAPNSRVEMGFAPGASVDIEVAIDASDEVELNKVDLVVNGSKVTTFKSEDGSDFNYMYTVTQPDTYAIKAVAYDAAGNESSSDTVSVEVWQDLEKKSKMEAYVYQVDSLIQEFRRFRQLFNQYYSAAQSMAPGDPEWTAVIENFYIVKDNRENLLTLANGFPVTAEFQAAQINLTQMLSAAIQADTFAIDWAISNGMNESAKEGIHTYSAICQSHGHNFQVSYDQARAACLGLGPGVPPH